MQPDPAALHQAVITLPIKDEKKAVAGTPTAATPAPGTPGLLQHQNFEQLLGRSSGQFMQTDTQQVRRLLTIIIKSHIVNNNI